MAASAPSLANLPDQKDFAAAKDDLVENGGVESDGGKGAHLSADLTCKFANTVDFRDRFHQIVIF
jgi:hypothetical protein